MSENEITRRGWFAVASAAVSARAGALAMGESHAEKSKADRAEPFLYGLNTSTIRGQKLTVVQEAELAAKAGFHGLEPWIRELDEHVRAGQSFDDLGNRLRDLGLSVESAIGFFEWAVDDEPRRKKALEEARRNMEMVRRIGGKRLAAPPAGATDRAVDLKRVAERYHALLELGDRMGIMPQVEVWGFSRTLGTLGEASMVAIEADHPSACILADIYHLYKGGSGFNGLKLLGKDAMHVLHVNDYPAEPPRAKISDADRVYPGDGIAPLKQVFRDLFTIGFRGMLSIELFNRTYWSQDAATVLKTGLDKLRAVVQSSLDGVPTK
jgi:sugar phosphate isomerase/epimerase